MDSGPDFTVGAEFRNAFSRIHHFLSKIPKINKFQSIYNFSEHNLEPFSSRDSYRLPDPDFCVFKKKAKSFEFSPILPINYLYMSSLENINTPKKAFLGRKWCRNAWMEMLRGLRLAQWTQQLGHSALGICGNILLFNDACVITIIIILKYKIISIKYFICV